MLGQRPTLADLAQVVWEREDQKAARLLAQRLHEQDDPPRSVAQFVMAIPIRGRMTTRIFELLACAWEDVCAEHEIRGLPEADLPAA